MAHGFKHGGSGGSASLNFRVIGGTSTPSNPKINDIWVNTDRKITSWHFGADEPNVYDVKLSFEGNNAWIDAPHQLSVGDILNFVIPGTHYSPLEDINIQDVITGKIYSIRDLDGTAVGEWTAGIKVGVKISNNIHPIGNHSGYHGSAYLVSWGSYYHEEGTVWVTTGASSPVAFNALKKNSVMVYPMSAKQYIGGSWVDKTAKSYQGGAWVDWIKYSYLFKSGEGEKVAFVKNSNGGQVTVSKDSVVLSCPNVGYNSVYWLTDGLYSLEDATELVFDAACYDNLADGNHAYMGRFVILNKKLENFDSSPEYMGDITIYASAWVTPDSERKEYVIDVSNLNDSYSIGFWGNSTITVYNAFTRA